MKRRVLLLLVLAAAAFVTWRVVVRNEPVSSTSISDSRMSSPSPEPEEPASNPLPAEAPARLSTEVEVSGPEVEEPATSAEHVVANEGRVAGETVTAAGIVLGRNDAPVAGAQVYLAYAGEEIPTPGSFARGPKPRTATDANGRFRIDSVRVGGICLLATHPEYCDSEYMRVTLRPESPQELCLRLREGARVFGSIDPSMGDLANRDVHLYSFRGSIGWRETRSDEKGRFAFEHVIPQDYVIDLKSGTKYVVKDGRTSEINEPTESGRTNLGVRKNITARDQETTEVVLGAPLRTITLNGRVICNGQPVADARVNATPMEGGEDRGERVASAADGTFRLTLDGAGEYAITTYLGRSDFWFREQIPSVETYDLTIELPGGAISGRLVDSQGRPIRERIHVTVREESAYRSEDPFYFGNAYHKASSDEEGRFEFRLLPSGTYTIRAPDGKQFDQSSFEPFGRATLRGVRVGTTVVDGIELVLPSECRIRVSIVDVLGHPAGGAYLYLEDDEGRPCSTYWEGQSDIAGTYEIRNVVPGRYHVLAHSGVQTAKSPVVVVEPEQSATTKIEFR